MSDVNSVFDELMNFSANNGDSSTVKKLKPSEKLLEDIKNYGFDMSQLEGVLKTKGNQLIVSSAGSGKTTSIIFKLIYDLKSGRSTVLRSLNGNSIRVPDSIWVATFLKSGADELKNSYCKWCYKLHCADMSQVMQFSTLHAEFKRALNTLGLETDIISEKDNRKLLKSVLSKYGVKGSRGVSINDDELNILIGAFTCTRNRLDEKRYEARIYEDLGLVGSIVDCILNDWKTARLAQNKVDFEDLQEILYDYCYIRKDESIIKFLSERYNFIYIDEFQDTSQIQYAILKIYSCDSKQIIAIGDDDQTIYSWRGSDNKIITSDFVKDFSPTMNNLSVNFRCPSRILNSIKSSIKNNTQRFEKVLRSSKEGGIVRVGKYSGYRQMAMALGDMVYEDVKKGLSVSVLCRVNSDGLLPALFFDKMNLFSYSISGNGMTLDSYIGRLVISIVKLFTDKYSADVSRALNFLSWDKYGIQKLLLVCKNNKESIWTISKDDLIYSCNDIANTIIKWRDFRNSTDDVTTLKLVLQEYRYNVFTKDSQFNDVVKSVLLSVESLLDYYDYSTVDDFLVELEDINERLKAREKKLKCQVQIATVHEFKGKESDSIYIWNDSEDVFPHKRSNDSVEDLEEERRVHYIACTRAKKMNTIMCIKGREGRFVREMDLSEAEVLKGNTSGVLKKAILEDSEVTKGLNKFKETVSIDDVSTTVNSSVNNSSTAYKDDIDDFDSI